MLPSVRDTGDEFFYKAVVSYYREDLGLNRVISRVTYGELNDMHRALEQSGVKSAAKITFPTSRVFRSKDATGSEQRCAELNAYLKKVFADDAIIDLIAVKKVGFSRLPRLVTPHTAYRCSS